jgi:hypothetical protein
MYVLSTLIFPDWTRILLEGVQFICLFATEATFIRILKFYIQKHCNKTDVYATHIYF